MSQRDEHLHKQPLDAVPRVERMDRIPGPSYHQGNVHPLLPQLDFPTSAVSGKAVPEDNQKLIEQIKQLREEKKQIKIEWEKGIKEHERRNEKFFDVLRPLQKMGKETLKIMIHSTYSPKEIQEKLMHENGVFFEQMVNGHRLAKCFISDLEGKEMVDCVENKDTALRLLKENADTGSHKLLFHLCYDKIKSQEVQYATDSMEVEKSGDVGDIEKLDKSMNGMQIAKKRKADTSHESPTSKKQRIESAKKQEASSQVCDLSNAINITLSQEVADAYINGQPDAKESVRKKIEQEISRASAERKETSHVSIGPKEVSKKVQSGYVSQGVSVSSLGHVFENRRTYRKETGGYITQGVSCHVPSAMEAQPTKPRQNRVRDPNEPTIKLRLYFVKFDSRNERDNTLFKKKKYKIQIPILDTPGFKDGSTEPRMYCEDLFLEVQKLYREEKGGELKFGQHSNQFWVFDGESNVWNIPNDTPLQTFVASKVKRKSDPCYFVKIFCQYGDHNEEGQSQGLQMRGQSQGLQIGMLADELRNTVEKNQKFCSNERFNKDGTLCNEPDSCSVKFKRLGKEHDEVRQICLDIKVVDKNKRDLYDLFAAAQNGDLEVFETNHKKKRDLTVKNDKGENVAHLAAKSGNLDILKKLFEWNVDMTAKTEKGLTPADYAYKAEQYKVLHQFHDWNIELKDLDFIQVGYVGEDSGLKSILETEYKVKVKVCDSLPEHSNNKLWIVCIANHKYCDERVLNARRSLEKNGAKVFFIRTQIEKLPRYHFIYKQIRNRRDLIKIDDYTMCMNAHREFAVRDKEICGTTVYHMSCQDGKNGWCLQNFKQEFKQIAEEKYKIANLVRTNKKDPAKGAMKADNVGFVDIIDFQRNANISTESFKCQCGQESKQLPNTNKSTKKQCKKCCIRSLFGKLASEADADSKYNTALHNSVHRNFEDLTRFLVAKGAILDRQDLKGRSALQFAVVKKRQEITKFLIAQGADLLVKNQNERDSLTLASRSEDTDLICLVYSKRREQMQKAVSVAAGQFFHKGNKLMKVILDFCISEVGMDVTQICTCGGKVIEEDINEDKKIDSCQYGHTYATKAAVLGCWQCTKHLFDNDQGLRMDVDKSRALDKSTALLCAAYRQKRKIVKLILEVDALGPNQGKCLSSVNVENKNVFHLAIANQDAHLVIDLCRHGRKTNCDIDRGILTMKMSNQIKNIIVYNINMFEAEKYARRKLQEKREELKLLKGHKRKERINELMINIFQSYLSNLFTMELFLSEIEKVVLEFEIDLDCTPLKTTMNEDVEMGDKNILDKLNAILTNCHRRVETGKCFFPSIGSGDTQQAKDVEFLNSLRGKDLGEDEASLYKQIVSKSPSFSESSEFTRTRSDNVVTRLLKFFQQQKPEVSRDYFFITVEPHIEGSPKKFNQKLNSELQLVEKPRESEDATFGLAKMEYCIVPIDATFEELIETLKNEANFNINRSEEANKNSDKVKAILDDAYSVDGLVVEDVTNKLTGHDLEFGSHHRLTDKFKLKGGEMYHFRLLRKHRDTFLRKKDTCTQLKLAAEAGDTKFKLMSHIRTVSSRDIDDKQHFARTNEVATAESK